MRFTLLSLLPAALAGVLPRYHPPCATVVIETSHNHLGIGPTNNTILVPIGPMYRNKTALAEVSTLYIPFYDGVTCIPYESEDGQGSHGNPFSYGFPTILQNGENVVVGSLYCISAW
ncbi:hypothetical protein SAMD00023353_9200170 [Rosellinia necatrix]|uniref:Uncharacterized protein n=1 Tax=Rosellinia necatrix TaxID=77044 RepID=A0A1W2TVE3_ROSNE|nr:hypothetical protein SAMD00023353_9200170 [Rosellinia necatrix]